jgi:SAM-dependent methyltransferase
MDDLPDPAAKWDDRYRQLEPPPGPALVLELHAHLLPRCGTALDLACGLGANALFLAARGLEVSAWDLSPVAIRRLQASARSQGLHLQAAVRDVLIEPPPADHFDLICVCHFLDRGLLPAIRAALRPGGLLCYQTFVREQVSERGPGDAAYRLATNELLDLAEGLVIRSYREEGRVGDLSQGIRDLALLVAQRPV